MKTAVFGLGKLGVPLVACLASRGHTVTGVDLNEKAVWSLNNGQSPVSETGVDSMVHAHRESISATTVAGEAIRGAGMIFVVVPTPSIADGSFSSVAVVSVCEVIACELERERSEVKPLVVVVSTLSPGSMNRDVLPAMERFVKAGTHFDLCYNPEFIALGSVVHDMLHPDMVLIGEYDKASGHRLEMFYESFCENDPHIQRMNFQNAELAKISVNSYVTMKISFANTLREMCHHMAGGNVDRVTDAIGCDSRIGHEYLTGATAYAGPCFPRDNHAFVAAGMRQSVVAELAIATEAINSKQADIVAREVLKYHKDGGTIGILGLTYKPGTDVVEESQGLAVIARLTEYKVVGSYRAYDPQGMERARFIFGHVTYEPSAEDCALESDVVVLMTPWPEFAKMAAEPFSGKIVIDCWRHMPPEQVKHAKKYIAMGVNDVV